jgi:hypothetical protein
MYRIKSSQNYSSSENDYKPFPVTFSLTGDALENLAREVLKMLKLFTESDIGGYNRLFKADIVKHFIDELGETKKLIAEAKAQKKLTLSVTISVQTEIIDNINKYLADPNAAPPKPVSEMNSEERFKDVIKRCLPLVPAEVADKLKALLSPVAVTLAVIVLIAWAVGHFFAISEIADVLLIVGAIALGAVAAQAAQLLVNFADKTINGKTEEDLDEAAKSLAEAIAMIGVQAVLALLLKKAPKVFNEPKVLHKNPIVTPRNFQNIGEPPTSSKFFFENYEGNLTLKKHIFAAEDAGGATTQWGDIFISYGKNTKFKEIEMAYFHETIHRLLTPRLQVFKSMRQSLAILKRNSYLQSYILRYLEEALAETFAQVKGNGWHSFFKGISFPFGENGYVTLASMGNEAKGILLGPISVGGMIFNVYFISKSK